MAVEADSSDLTEAEILDARPAAFRILSRRLRETVLWKVHEAFLVTARGEALFPAEVTVGAAYILRDPRDVAVALAKHNGTGIDAAIAAMADRQACGARQRVCGSRQLPQPMLDWSGHVESWLDRPGFPVLVVRFEDMVGDLGAVLRRVAAAAGITASDAAVAGAVAATRFDRLQAQELAAGFIERPRTAERFFRSGTAGGWRQALSPAQSARIVADHGRVMARLRYL